MVGALIVAALLLTFGWGVSRGGKQARAAEKFRVSRGEFFDNVLRITRKFGHWYGRDYYHVFVLPDGWRVPPSGLFTFGIPKRFLDVMSRVEIDSLVARDLAERSEKSTLNGVANVCLVVAFVGGWYCGHNLSLWRGPLCLLAIGVGTLGLRWPHWRLRAAIRAIRVTGDAESFFSAAAEKSRLTGSRLDLPLLEGVARRVGVPSERLATLLARRDGPAENRYPTEGDYLTTGFQSDWQAG